MALQSAQISTQRSGALAGDDHLERQLSIVDAGQAWSTRLNGDIATPSEAAGVGVMLCLAMVIVTYRVWRPTALRAILRDGR